MNTIEIQERIPKFLLLSRSYMAAVMDTQSRVLWSNQYFKDFFAVEKLPVFFSSLFQPHEIEACESVFSALKSKPNVQLTLQTVYFQTIDCEISFFSESPSLFLCVAHRTEAMLNEQELLQQIETDKLIFATMHDGIVVHDLTGAITFCNERAEEILGLTRDQMAGKTSIDPLWETVKPDGSPFAGQDHPAMHTLRTGEPQKDVLMGVHKPNGQTTWISINSSMLYHIETQQPYAVYAIFHDVTEQIKIEKELVANRNFLSTLISNLPGYVYRVANDAKFSAIYVSEGVFEVTGYTQSEYLEERITSCGLEIHPNDTDRVWNTLQESIALQQPYELEYQLITKTGQVKWVWERGRGIFNEHGILLHLEGFITDVTERVKLKQRLAFERKQLEAITDALDNSAIVTVTDLQGRILKVNKKFCELSGYTEAELLGQTHRMINSGHHNKEFWSEMWRTIASGQTWYAEVKNKAKDGSYYWVYTINNPLLDVEGKIVQYLSIRFDITNLKQAQERILAQNQTLREISFAQAHTLRRPIANIVGLMYLVDLDKHKGTQVIQKYLDYIKDSAKEADEVIHQIIAKATELE